MNTTAKTNNARSWKLLQYALACSVRDSRNQECCNWLYEMHLLLWKSFD